MMTPYQRARQFLEVNTGHRIGTSELEECVVRDLAKFGQECIDENLLRLREAATEFVRLYDLDSANFDDAEKSALAALRKLLSAAT